MKITESKNLKYNQLCWIGPYEGYEKIEPRVCLLESFTRTNDRLDLYFKNRSRAVIRAVNVEGGRELDLIERKLPDLIEKSYQEILEIEF